jgi:hypothetical protein
MGNAELIEVWKWLRTIEDYIFKVAMQYEGVERALEASMPEFEGRRTEHQTIAAQLHSGNHEGRLRAIDAVIRRLESPAPPSR